MPATAPSAIAPTIPPAAPISAMTGCGTPARKLLIATKRRLQAPFSFLAPRRQRDRSKRENQRGDLAGAERLAQRERGSDNADHRHGHGADRRDRGRQPRQRRKPADIGNAE